MAYRSPNYKHKAGNWLAIEHHYARPALARWLTPARRTATAAKAIDARGGVSQTFSMDVITIAGIRAAKAVQHRLCCIIFRRPVALGRPGAAGAIDLRNA
jgi:hypothetical protein